MEKIDPIVCGPLKHPFQALNIVACQFSNTRLFIPTDLLFFLAHFYKPRHRPCFFFHRWILFFAFNFCFFFSKNPCTGLNEPNDSIAMLLDEASRHTQISPIHLLSIQWIRLLLLRFRLCVFSSFICRSYVLNAITAKKSPDKTFVVLFSTS